MHEERKQGEVSGERKELKEEKKDGKKDGVGVKKEPKESKEEYNKSIQEMNNRMFDDVEETTLSNPEDNSDQPEPKKPSESDLKVEDFDPPQQPSPPSLIQETRKPAQKKVKTPPKQSPAQAPKSQKLSKKASGEKAHKEGQKKPKKKSVNEKNLTLEESKQANKPKAWQSEPDDQFGSPSGLGKPKKIKEKEKMLEDTTSGKLENQLSYAWDAKSTRSEDKNDEVKIKWVNSTNPTSETSSFKDSSVHSQQEMKNIASPFPPKSGKGQKSSGKQAQNEQKTLKERRSGKKSKKPLKSDRPKYG